MDHLFVEIKVNAVWVGEGVTGKLVMFARLLRFFRILVHFFKIIKMDLDEKLRAELIEKYKRIEGGNWLVPEVPDSKIRTIVLRSEAKQPLKPAIPLPQPVQEDEYYSKLE